MRFCLANEEVCCVLLENSTSKRFLAPPKQDTPRRFTRMLGLIFMKNNATEANLLRLLLINCCLVRGVIQTTRRTASSKSVSRNKIDAESGHKSGRFKSARSPAKQVFFFLPERPALVLVTARTYSSSSTCEFPARQASEA